MENIKELYSKFISSSFYQNLDETEEARATMERTYSLMENKLCKNDLLTLEDIIMSTNVAYEQQGFMYGFRYAMRLLIDCGYKVGDVA